MTQKKKSGRPAVKKSIKKHAHVAIVKRRGHTELYDERKVYGSSYFACRNAHLSEVESEKISEKVAKAVTLQIKKKKIASSDYIFWLITEELKKHNEDAAFLFETHRDIS